MNVERLTLADAASQIERGKLSPLDLTKSFLERIQRLNPSLNAFLTITDQDALKSAADAEREIHGGRYRGPLHGIPVAVKDIFETAGVRTTAGSKILSQNFPREDATVVSRLRALGTIILGKTSLHEWALGVTNDNPHFGPTRNPWAIDRIPGGSSGGSAAALAAKLCLGALGTDTGGSIRIPASACGVVGLKPTRGLVSLRGVIPLSWSLDHAGPMAWTAKDVSLLLDAIAGYDKDDPESVRGPSESNYAALIDQQIDGTHIAVPANYFFDSVESDVVRAVRDAAKTFEKLGADVSEVSYENVEQDFRANGVILLSDAAAVHRDILANRKSEIGNDVATRLEQGSRITAVEYALARRMQGERKRQRALFFEKFDVLMTPTIPVEPPARVGLDALSEALDLTRFTCPFNLIGFPAVSVPCGFSRNGLPIGMQLISGPWHDGLLLRVANAYQQETEWHNRQPLLQ